MPQTLLLYLPAMYLPLKALHIIAVVAWFAGLFYIVRLFVYLRETQDRSLAERQVLEPQLLLMAHRLWFGIAWPAGLAALTFGLLLLPLFWPPAPWLWIKLGLVVGLCGYHLACHRMFQGLAAGKPVATSAAFRVWNELATLFLVSIVFLVVLKQAISVVWASLGLLVFSGLLMAGIVAYRKRRMRAETPARSGPGQ